MLTNWQKKFDTTKKICLQKQNFGLLHGRILFIEFRVLRIIILTFDFGLVHLLYSTGCIAVYGIASRVINYQWLRNSWFKNNYINTHFFQFYNMIKLFDSFIVKIPLNDLASFKWIFKWLNDLAKFHQISFYHVNRCFFQKLFVEPNR